MMTNLIDNIGVAPSLEIRGQQTVEEVEVEVVELKIHPIMS